MSKDKLEIEGEKKLCQKNLLQCHLSKYSTCRTENNITRALSAADAINFQFNSFKMRKASNSIFGT